jgi:E3 ubiquitin-protein ligase HERC1
LSGLLLGIAVRTRKPINLSLAPIFWKMLLKRGLAYDDLEDVDLNYARSIRAMGSLKRRGSNYTN